MDEKYLETTEQPEGHISLQRIGLVVFLLAATAMLVAALLISLDPLR